MKCSECGTEAEDVLNRDLGGKKTPIVALCEECCSKKPGRSWMKRRESADPDATTEQRS